MSVKKKLNVSQVAEESGQNGRCDWLHRLEDRHGPHQAGEHGEVQVKEKTEPEQDV